MKRKIQLEEAWVRNIMKVYGYSLPEAQLLLLKIKPYG